MKGIRPETILLALAAVLAPVIGGQVSQEPMPLGGDLFAEMLGGPSLPLMSRALLAVMVLGALAFSLVRRQVLPVPAMPLVASLGGLVALLGMSSFVSAFPTVSVSVWWTWVLYAGAFGLAVACLGREKGPALTLGAIVVGCGIVGAKGVVEYMGQAITDPTWRVFAGWNNPNGTASIVLGGALLAIGVGAALRGPWRWGAWLCGGLSLATLWLTQSKGGLGAFAVGLLCLVVVAFLVKRPKELAIGAVVVMVLAAVITVGVRPRTAAAGGAAIGPRVFQASATQVQSEDFRKNLWKSAIQISKDHPIGVGAGNFRFYSAQPGLSDQTVFAHQSFLQVAAEGTWLALAALAYFLLRWFARVLPTHESEPDQRRLMKASVVAVVLAWCAHGFFESNIYYLGLGLPFFIVLGVGVQLADDMSSPEWSPTWLRGLVAVVCCVGPLLAMVIAGQKEITKAAFMSALGTPQMQAAAEQLEAVGDPESTYLLGVYASENLDKRLERLKLAAEKYPRTKVLRALARTQLQAQKPAEALGTLERALTFDPHGLNTLLELMRTQDVTGDKEAAAATARRMIGLETSPSYTVRAIPEIIQTETFEARVYLASLSKDPAEKAKLFGQATEGYKRFVAVTAPRVNTLGDFGGIDRKRAMEIVTSGQAANAQYAQALRDLGQADKAKAADADDQGFVAALADLSKPK